MSTVAWLDQRAAGIRSNREGNPTPWNVASVANGLAARFPDLDPKVIGAVLITLGALLTDAWTQLEEKGATPPEILEALLALTDMGGEYLYAPEGGAS